MNVFVNNEQRVIETQKTIHDLLADLSINGSRGIAVAVNNEVIPKTTWSDFCIRENDRVTVIKATQGG
jgi:sulfur carrier protein